MKILITGARGFIGKNLVTELKSQGYNQLYLYDLDSGLIDLEYYTRDCDFVFHLAGVNRPIDSKDYKVGNYDFTLNLLENLKKNNNTCPIVLASSIQAENGTPYGVSKKMGEDLLLEYGSTTGANVMIYRFPNVFGKWSKPNYNSVIATFSYNIANGLPIRVDNNDITLNLIYIDDLVKELISALRGKANKIGDFCFVKPVYLETLGRISELLYTFKSFRENGVIPNLSDSFIQKLYATYLSYLPKNQFGYNLKMNLDSRGSFTEFLKTENNGQISINISKPGITKGNHWHHTKTEKFLVVYGSGIIRFRKVGEEDIIEYSVNGEKLQVIDIPPGYTHNIKNLGTTDMVTVMWASEKYDSNRPDTIFEEV